MQIIHNPTRNTWPSILSRPVFDSAEIEKRVAPILQAVKTKGDEALIQFAKQFDGLEFSSFEVSSEEVNRAIQEVPEELKHAIDAAYANIYCFHLAQKSDIVKIETMPGVTCWRKSVGIQRVGIYIPGGTAPLFSTVLMLGVPAQIAGCQEVVLCSPSNHPAIYYAAKKVGVTRIFRVGGAQAVAAMAYGTESIPSVYKIFGPGNQYVTTAKQLVSKEGVAIDMPAGPSEVAVLVDETAVPAFVAADLLSQAEHGVDSQVVLVSTDADIIQPILDEVERQVALLPRQEIARAALQNSKAIYMNDLSDAIDLLNEYAAEHLIISTKDAEKVSEEITNAGSMFLGNYTPESCGDYASGTNHTLPTNGFARAYSGVSLDSFVKKITIQHISEAGLRNVGPVVEKMAEAESLIAHKEAVSIRLASLLN